MATQTSQNKLLDIEFFIEAACQHGEDSEPDHEVGDLQDLLRGMWALLTPAQRVAFAMQENIQQVLENSMGDYEAEVLPSLAALPKLVNEAMDNRWEAPLNLFTTTVKERFLAEGPVMVQMRNGSYEKVRYREADEVQDTSEMFENEAGTKIWRLNGASITSSDFDMMSLA